MQDEKKAQIYGVLVCVSRFFFGDCMVIRGTLLNNVERDYQTV